MNLTITNIHIIFMDLSINPKSVPIATNTIVIIYDDTNSRGSISKSFI